MQRKHIFLACTATAAMLAGCGGGGSGINTPPPQGTPHTDIVSALVASSYDGEELAAFNAFNAARMGCGFGSLLQNTRIDHAALNHLTWMAENNSFSHYETAATPAFTGVDLGTRLGAVAYTDWVSYAEVLTAQTGASKSGFGLLGARNLLAAPYHLMGLMQGNREIGLSVKSGGPIGSAADIRFDAALTRLWFVADMAASRSLLPQAQAATEVLTYPCQDVSDTAWQLTNESPNPIPGRDLAARPIGQPVLVQVLAGQALTISSAVMLRTADRSPVPIAVILGAGNDANLELSGNQALIIPDLPLSPGTQYSVTLRGSNNGSTFLKTFNFSTGI